jgi:hypothetical protein
MPSGAKPLQLLGEGLRGETVSNAGVNNDTAPLGKTTIGKEGCVRMNCSF